METDYERWIDLEACPPVFVGLLRGTTGEVERADVMLREALPNGQQELLVLGESARALAKLVRQWAGERGETAPHLCPQTATGEWPAPSMPVGKQLPPHPVPEEQRDTFDRYKDVSA